MNDSFFETKSSSLVVVGVVRLLTSISFISAILGERLVVVFQGGIFLFLARNNLGLLVIEVIQ
jgi:hypothetical protein